MSLLSSTTSPWLELPGEFRGGVEPTAADVVPTNTLLVGMAELDRGHSYLAYCGYHSAAVLYDRYVAVREHTDGLVMDGLADCAARLSGARGITRHAAEVMINDALALRDRLPSVFTCLRDGVIAQWQASMAIVRTDLLMDSDKVAAVDHAIAELLRGCRGAWSRRRFRDMLDRLVFREDPDAVRERRKDALDKRGVWTEPREDGTAEITGVMAAENVRIAAESVAALAATACRHDGRTKPQRLSDAMFAMLSGTPFDCECGRTDCPATASEAITTTKIVVHVVCDEKTLDGRAENAGWMDGHGVISDVHVRELASRPDASIRPLGTTAATHLPSDPYRPNAALDTLVRVSNGYCVEPACDRSAFECDLDHVAEYDHECPERGGQTTADGLNAKCRGGHLLKTFGEWVDDQYRDESGRLVIEFTTPEGLTIPGPAETNEDLFPGLRRLRIVAPRQPPPDLPDHPTPTAGTRTRLAAKYARRKAERERNRVRRTAEPPPY